MTREEAKEILKHIGNNIVTINTYGGKIWHKEDITEARNLAIKALEQEPCEDCICRENTLKAMLERLGVRNENHLFSTEATLYKVVKNMPHVTPQPKTDILEKIKAEIESLNNIDYVEPITVDEILQIIDKYNEHPLGYNPWQE